jgi:hypothetical protein
MISTSVFKYCTTVDLFFADAIGRTLYFGLSDNRETHGTSGTYAHQTNVITLLNLQVILAD